MADNGYILLGILQSYAPDAKAQALCAEMFNAAKAGDWTDDEIVKSFCMLLLDGIRYGNWPWNKTTVSEKLR